MVKLTAILMGLLIISLFIPFSFALQVSDIEQNIQENNTQISALRADTLSKLAEINSKMDKYLTDEEAKALLEGHLVIVDKLLENYRTNLTITWALMCLATLGGAFGIFFYFKGKRRL